MGVPIILIITPITGILSIFMAYWFAKNVMKEDSGNEAMITASKHIEQGAKTFIKRQYFTLTIFVICLAIILLFLPVTIDSALRPDIGIDTDLNWEQSLAYIIGSIASMGAGWLGMVVGIKANAKTAQACTKGIKEGFDVAFFGGAVMGLATVGAALISVPLLYWWIPDPKIILGFSFGASGIALFMKCGGGIFTKAADVGADLVGKSEYDLPEDDPRNPATIADNVGDNVGDIAGMGADLFDSYVASIVAAMLLATAFVAIGRSDVTALAQPYFVIYPLLLCGIGLIASLIGILLIKRGESENPGKALNNGTYLATIIFGGLALVLTFIITLSPDISTVDADYFWKDYLAAMCGLASGIVIGFTTDYFTREDRTPTSNIAKSAEEGHAVVILSGFSYGLLSVVPPAIGIVVAMGAAYALGNVFGVAMAAVGMLAIVGTIVTNDAYGPITDNARGVAEAGGLDEEVIRIADHLDSAGNTAKAITKGFAIGAANLTVLALLFSFTEEAKAISGDASFLESINLLNIEVLIGAFLGVIAPALFSALLILSVQKTAALMVDEIRRQFEANPKILEGTEAADYEKCIDIATKGALRELVLPSILSISLPLIVGILLGIEALAAFLAGAILSGFVFAIFMSNAGGSWDNAKKFIEDGNLGGKGTETHKAAITGDTVGDPMKDTAGPSINTLLVVMSLTATIFLAFLMSFNGGTGFIIF